MRILLPLRHGIVVCGASSFSGCNDVLPTERCSVSILVVSEIIRPQSRVSFTTASVTHRVWSAVRSPLPRTFICTDPVLQHTWNTLRSAFLSILLKRMCCRWSVIAPGLVQPYSMMTWSMCLYLTIAHLFFHFLSRFIRAFLSFSTCAFVFNFTNND